MPKCDEIATVTKPSQDIEGRGKSETEALDDLYRKAEAKCQEYRKTLGKPCSDGTGCADKENCKDEAELENGQETHGKDDQGYWSRWKGDIKCKCKCK